MTLVTWTYFAGFPLQNKSSTVLGLVTLNFWEKGGRWMPSLECCDLGRLVVVTCLPAVGPRFLCRHAPPA